MLPFLFAFALTASPAPIHLHELIDEARKNNPELQAAHKEAYAMASSVDPAGALDDPMLMVQLWNGPIDFSTVPLMVQLSQSIPLGGKRSARRDIAVGEASAAQANAVAKARDIEAAVAKDYFELYLADRTLEADVEIERALRSLIATASSRIAAGRGEQSEALRAQAELLKLQSDEEDSRARRIAAAAHLVALLNRSPGSDIGSTTNPGLLQGLPSEIQLRDRALRDRPEIAWVNAKVAQAKARARLARAEQVPDINVSLGEMHSFRSTGLSDFLFAGFQVNLPVWAATKNSPRVDAANTQVMAAEADDRAVENRIVAEVAVAYAHLNAEQRQVKLHHQLIPVARQALSSATASYVAGKGGFLMVLDSERELLMHQLDLASHLAIYEQHLVDLEHAVGGDLGLVRASESGVQEEH